MPTTPFSTNGIAQNYTCPKTGLYYRAIEGMTKDDPLHHSAVIVEEGECTREDLLEWTRTFVTIFSPHTA